MENPPPRINTIFYSKCAPLALTQYLHEFPQHYLKSLPKFNGEDETTIEEHILAFQGFLDNMNIDNEDVWMRIFVQRLDGQVGKWFRGLPTNSIATIEDLDETI